MRDFPRWRVYIKKAWLAILALLKRKKWTEKKYDFENENGIAIGYVIKKREEGGD